MLPELEYIGKDDLPKGWLRPTRALVKECQLFHREGLAEPSARQLYRRATSAPRQASTTIQRNTAKLASFVDPRRSKVTAAGMAYPQLRAASGGSLRIFAAIVDMHTTRSEDRVKGKVFTNPTVKQKGSGREAGIEQCFSAPGLAVVVKRWKTLTLESVEHPLATYEGAPARFVQHENDHLDGTICIDVGSKQGSPIYFVPTEVKDLFYNEYVRKNRVSDWPLILPVAQWRAMKTGRFSFLRYARFL